MVAMPKAILATAGAWLLLGGCETMPAEQHSVVIPLDATIWTNGLTQSDSPISVAVFNTTNHTSASVQLSQRSLAELHFEPSPLEILQPLIQTYGAKLIEALAPSAPPEQTGISIHDFKVLLNPRYENDTFAVLLQFELHIGEVTRLITAIGSHKAAQEPDPDAYRRATHEAIGTALAHSRLAIGIELENAL